MFIPTSFLRQLYVRGSLQNVDLDGDGEPEGVSFKLRNTLAGGSIRGSLKLRIDRADVDPSKVILEYRGEKLRASEAGERTMYFGVGDEITITAELGKGLDPGDHTVELEVKTLEYGAISFDFTDTIK